MLTTRWKCAMLHCEIRVTMATDINSELYAVVESLIRFLIPRFCFAYCQTNIICSVVQTRALVRYQSDHDKIKYGMSSLEDLN